MIPLVYNYQVGNPNATYPPSLTVKSSDAGVTVLSLAPTHKYVAFGLTSTPPLPPSLGYLTWTPIDQGITAWIPLVFTGSNIETGYTLEQFQAVDPTTVGYIGFFAVPPPFPGVLPSLTTSISNFLPYTNLSFIAVNEQFISDIDLQGITLVPNETYGGPPTVSITENPALTAINNIALGGEDYEFAGNNLVKTSVDNILIELENSGIINGSLTLQGGNNDSFTPGGAGQDAYTTLLVRGWAITYNTGGLSQLDSNNNALSNTIASYVYNGTFYYNSSIDTFNGVVVGNDFEGVTRITFTNGNVLTSISNINSYVNLTNLVGQNMSVSTLDLTWNTSLQGILLNFNSLLTTITFGPYYKNLTAVYLNDNNLDLTTVETIIETLYNGGKNDGFLFLNGGTNAVPSPLVASYITALLSRGWTISTN